MTYKDDNIGILILGLLFLLLIIGGIISYQSIDWTVLQRIENQTIILPTPIITQTATPSAIDNQ